MSKRSEQAVAYHKKGYNCAQSVLCAFSDMLDIEEKEAFRVSEGFGLGMGNMDGPCGAVTGAVMALGLFGSDGNLEGPKTKKETYHKVRDLTAAFEEKNGSVICRRLKGQDGGPVLRSCDGCIEDAAQLLEEALGESEKDD